MTADIRTAAEREAERRTIEPNVDDPLPADHHALGWRKGFRYGAVWGAARVTPTREQVKAAASKAWDEWWVKDGSQSFQDALADAMLKLIQELAEGERDE